MGGNTYTLRNSSPPHATESITEVCNAVLVSQAEYASDQNGSMAKKRDTRVCGFSSLQMTRCGTASMNKLTTNETAKYHHYDKIDSLTKKNRST